MVDYNHVFKDKCATEFMKLKECYLVRFVLLFSPYSPNFSLLYSCFWEERHMKNKSSRRKTEFTKAEVGILTALAGKREESAVILMVNGHEL